MRSAKTSGAMDVTQLEDMDLGAWERWGGAPRGWQRCQLCETSECAGLKRSDGVETQMQEWTFVYDDDGLLDGRDTNDVRPENAPDGRDVMELECK